MTGQAASCNLECNRNKVARSSQRNETPLTPRKASSRELLPSLWPPMATISGIGRDSPNATAAACNRLDVRRQETGEPSFSRNLQNQMHVHHALLFPPMHLYASYRSLLVALP